MALGHPGGGGRQYLAPRHLMICPSVIGNSVHRTAGTIMYSFTCKQVWYIYVRTYVCVWDSGIVCMC